MHCNIVFIEPIKFCLRQNHFLEANLFKLQCIKAWTDTMRTMSHDFICKYLTHDRTGSGGTISTPPPHPPL